MADLTHECPGCANYGTLTDNPNVAKCGGCGGFFSIDTLTEREVGRYVRLDQPMLARAAGEMFYFDFRVWTEWRGKTVVGRLHGFADTATKRVVQFG